MPLKVPVPFPVTDGTIWLPLAAPLKVYGVLFVVVLFFLQLKANTVKRMKVPPIKNFVIKPDLVFIVFVFVVTIIKSMDFLILTKYMPGRRSGSPEKICS